MEADHVRGVVRCVADGDASLHVSSTGGIANGGSEDSTGGRDDQGDFGEYADASDGCGRGAEGDSVSGRKAVARAAWLEGFEGSDPDSTERPERGRPDTGARKNGRRRKDVYGRDRCGDEEGGPCAKAGAGKSGMATTRNRRAGEDCG